MAKREKQPAKISYFYGPGWNDLNKFIKTFWNLNRDDIKARQEKFEHGKGIMTLKGSAALASCLFLIFFGTLSFLLISGIVSAVLVVAFLIVYIFIFLAWLLDRIALLRRHIFVACPNCKEKYLIPTYLCPSCGAKHSWLVPLK